MDFQLAEGQAGKGGQPVLSCGGKSISGTCEGLFHYLQEVCNAGMVQWPGKEIQESGGSQEQGPTRGGKGVQLLFRLVDDWAPPRWCWPGLRGHRHCPQQEMPPVLPPGEQGRIQQDEKHEQEVRTETSLSSRRCKLTSEGSRHLPREGHTPENRSALQKPRQLYLARGRSYPLVLHLP